MQPAVPEPRGNSVDNLPDPVNPAGLSRATKYAKPQRARRLLYPRRISLKFGKERATPAFSPLISAISIISGPRKLSCQTR
jgi:hypothetical protein